MILKILIMLDFNHQQTRPLIHVLRLQDFYLGSIFLEPFDSSIDVNRCVVAFERFGEKTYHVKTNSKLDLKSTFERIKSYLKG